MRECSEYEITIEKLLNVVHSYTDPIRIRVIIGDAWLTCEEARGTRRLHDFYLTTAHTKHNDEEKERLLKYYKDVPVWNITAWHDVDCREIRYGVEARCHYKDVREGYLAEKADKKRAKERERRKKKREQTERKGRAMRLIDADVLPRHGQRGGLVHWKDIKNAPTIDAVEVVRCRDCKHRYMGDLNVWECTFGLMIIPDGFCNYGEEAEK